MSRVSIDPSAKLHHQLAEIADRRGIGMEECLLNALKAYAEQEADVYKTDLCAVDNLERAFFLSVAE